MVDEYLPHGQGGGGEKMTAILPITPLHGQAQPRLIDQYRRLKRLGLAMAPQMLGSQGPEFRVDDRVQDFPRVECREIVG